MGGARHADEDLQIGPTPSDSEERGAPERTQNPALERQGEQAIQQILGDKADIGEIFAAMAPDIAKLAKAGALQDGGANYLESELSRVVELFGQARSVYSAGDKQRTGKIVAQLLVVLRRVSRFAASTSHDEAVQRLLVLAERAHGLASG